MEQAPDRTKALQAYEPLRLREVISYSLGDVGVNLYWAPLAVFLMSYLTDVVGLSVVEAGTLLAVMRTVSAFAEPLFAALADRTRTDYGRYRPWFLWLAIPLAASGLLLFSTANAPHEVHLAAAYVGLILMNLVYTAINVPYNALSGVITFDSRQREVLLSARYGIAFLTAVLITWLTPKLVAFTGPNEVALGWQFAMTIFGVIAIGIFINLFLNTRERFSLSADPRKNPLRDIADLFECPPWLVLFVLGVIVMTGFTLHTASVPFFARYVLGRPDVGMPLSMVFILGLAAGSALTSTLTRHVERRLLISVMLGVFALTSLGFYALPDNQVQLAFALQVMTGTVLGVVSTITFAMTADTADHNAWRNGHRATAMTYSMINVGKKIAMALVALVVAWAFATHGTAGAEASPQLLTNVRLMIGLAPAVLAVAGALVAQFYGLNAETLAREQVGSL
ncbi:MFS transporter [Asticcacaulis solisilvae]|uniref:MFS transporter n=1 Tax=Asticcacaulis solisilvae TaxID=1217274 RepID=UPI003FD8845A